MRPHKRPSEAGVEAGGRPKQQSCSLSSAVLPVPGSLLCFSLHHGISSPSRTFPLSSACSGSLPSV